MARVQTGSTKMINLAILLVIGVTLVVAVMLLPKGFSDDLSKIGQGSVVVVLTHNKNAVSSIEMMEMLNRVRPDYGTKVDFLAADIDTPEGEAFARQQRAGGVVLVIFGKDGSKLGLLSDSTDEQKLRSTLDGVLSH